MPVDIEIDIAKFSIDLSLIATIKPGQGIWLALFALVASQLVSNTRVDVVPLCSGVDQGACWYACDFGIDHQALAI